MLHVADSMSRALEPRAVSAIFPESAMEVRYALPSAGESIRRKGMPASAAGFAGFGADSTGFAGAAGFTAGAAGFAGASGFTAGFTGAAGFAGASGFTASFTGAACFTGAAGSTGFEADSVFSFSGASMAVCCFRAAV
jgi:hypothetical protein